jgi:hypothetical protein
MSSNYTDSEMIASSEEDQSSNSSDSSGTSISITNSPSSFSSTSNNSSSKDSEEMKSQTWNGKVDGNQFEMTRSILQSKASSIVNSREIRQAQSSYLYEDTSNLYKNEMNGTYLISIQEVDESYENGQVEDQKLKILDIDASFQDRVAKICTFEQNRKGGSDESSKVMSVLSKNSFQSEFRTKRTRIITCRRKFKKRHKTPSPVKTHSSSNSELNEQSHRCYTIPISSFSENDEAKPKGITNFDGVKWLSLNSSLTIRLLQSSIWTDESYFESLDLSNSDPHNHYLFPRIRQQKSIFSESFLVQGIIDYQLLQDPKEKKSELLYFECSSQIFKIEHPDPHTSNFDVEYTKQYENILEREVRLSEFDHSIENEDADFSMET